MSEIASAYVTILPSLKGAGPSIAKQLDSPAVRSAADKAGKSTGSRLGSGLKAAFGAAVAAISVRAIADLTKNAVTSFAELEDSTAAAGVIFGKSMGSIVKQSKGAASKLGLSSQQVISAANTFGTYGKSAGLAGKDLAKFSTDQTALAADMASFKGTSPEEAIEAIGSALRGEAEPIRKYGVLLDDATLRNTALKMGLISTTKDALTPQQKVLAAQKAIWEQTRDAQGDYARTSDSTANVQKRLQAETANLSAKFGEVLAPAFTWAREKAIVVVDAISKLLDRVQSFQDALSKGADTTGLVKALGIDPRAGLGKFVGKVIVGVGALVAAFKTGTSQVTATGFAEVMQRIGGALRTAFDAIKGAVTSGDFSGITDHFGSIMDVVRPFGSVLAGAAGGLGDMAYSVGEVIGSGIKLLPGLIEGMGNAAQWLADHQGVLNTIMIGAASVFVAYKVAQAAANIAALLSVPLKIAEIGANVALTKSNRALITARKAETGAAVTQQSAAKTGLILRVREAAASALSAGKTFALAAAQKVAAVGQWLLNAAMTANPIGLIIAGIVLLVAGLVWFFTKTTVGRKIVAAAWDGIKKAVSAVVDWWTGTAWPAINRFFSGISRVVANVVNWIRKNWPLLLAIITGPIGLAVLFVIRNWDKIKSATIRVWNAVKGAIVTAWNAVWGFLKKAWGWIDQQVFAKFRLGLLLLRVGFQVARDKVIGFFSGIWSNMKLVWSYIRDLVFAKFRAGLTALKDAFRSAKDGIATIWNKLKEIAAKPINFVINTVYMGGIRAFVGKIFDFFGKKNPLPVIKPVKFAQGSEDHRAQIARGGAMRLWAEPETGGEAYIPLASSKRGRSTEILSKVASTFGYGLTRYAGGGFFGEAADFLRGPVDYVKNKTSSVIKDKFGGRSGGFWDLLTEVPKMLVGPLATYAKNKLGSLFGGGGGGAKYDGKAAGAMGWRRQWDVVKQAFPNATLNSAYRPGAVTAVGTPSYHGMGRAIDVTPSMAIFDWLAKSFPFSTELIYSPANNRQLYKGQRTLFGEPTRGDHFDHIHWAMRRGGILPSVYDQGGWLPPGGVGVNRTGKPEAVLSPAQSQALVDGRGQRPVSLTFHTTRVTPRDVVYAQRLADLLDPGATA